MPKTFGANQPIAVGCSTGSSVCYSAPVPTCKPPSKTLRRQRILGRTLSKQFRAYGADAKLSILQLVTTLVPLGGLLAARHYPIALMLAIPAAGLLVRLFIIQHDCGHGSYFKARTANERLGRALSLLTLTPYARWKQGHAAHHAWTGNLDRRGAGGRRYLDSYRILGRDGIQKVPLSATAILS